MIGMKCISCAMGAIVGWTGVSSGQVFQRVVGTQRHDTGLDIKYTPFAGLNIPPGLVLVGFTEQEPNTPPRDMVISRHRMDGSMIWGEVLGFPLNNDVAYTVTPLVDGFAVGFETSAGDSLDFGVMKISHGGGFVWGNLYTGSPFLDFPAGVSVRTAKNGDIVATGRHISTTTGLLNGVLVRAGPAGASVFRQEYAFPAPLTDVSFTDVAELEDGSLVVSGTVTLKPAVGPNVISALWAHFTGAGVPLAWTVYSVPGLELTADGIDTNPSVPGASVLAGRQRPTGSGAAFDTTNVWIVDIAGAVMHANSYQNFVCAFQAVKFSPAVDATYVLVSGSASAFAFPDGEAAMMLLPPPLGAPVWSRHYGAPVFDRGHGAVPFPDPSGDLGGFAMIGATEISVLSPRDEYFVKATPTGHTFCDDGMLTVNLLPLEMTQRIVQSAKADITMQPVEYPVIGAPASKQICPVCSPCVGDLNGDSLVDDDDFVIFAHCYDLLIVGDAQCYCADMNHDGLVDDDDFVIFVGAYNMLLCP